MDVVSPNGDPAHFEETRLSTFPDIEVMRFLEEHAPWTIKELVQADKEERAFRHELTRSIHASEKFNMPYGMSLAFGALVSLEIFCGYLAYLGFGGYALSIVILQIVGVLSVFIENKEKDKASKDLSKALPAWKKRKKK